MGAAMSRFITVDRAIVEAMSAPYAYNKNDCFMLALTVIDALRGTSYVKKYKGRYTTIKGAHRALLNDGHKSFVTFFEALLEAEPVGFGSAQIGDIAVCDLGGAEHLAVYGGNVWHSISLDGPVTFTNQDVKAVFKV